MRNAPSVSYLVGRSAFLGGLTVGVGVLGMTAVVLVITYGNLSAGLLLFPVWLVWALAAWRMRSRQVHGRLTWSAKESEWSWSSAAYLHGVGLSRVERVYDLQAWILLRLHNPDGARIWVWAERQRDPVHWDALRRALRAHA